MQGPAIKLRPVMRGKIVFKPPKISISGTWAAQEADTTWSDFAYRSTGPVILPKEVTLTTPPIDFDATGYFNISAPGRAPQRCNETAMRLRIGGRPWPEAKPADRPPMQPEAPLVGVRGDGRNRHGTFRIVGSFCPASGGVWLLKVYTGGPEDSKRASRDAAKRSRGLPSPTPVLGGRAPRLAALEPRASSVQLSQEMQHCLSMTRRILSDPASGPFASPVDPVRDHCPTYFTVVKHPMDLGTVMRNTAQGKYASHEEWAVDVARVFTNATAFNPPEHWVHSSAAKLHREFKVQYARFVEAQASRERDAALKERAMAEAAATAAAAIGAAGSARPASVADSASTSRHGSGQRRAAAKAQRAHAAAARAADEDYPASSAASASKGKGKSKSGGAGGKGARGSSGGKEARRGSSGAAGSRAKRPRLQQAFSDHDEDDPDQDSLDLGLESDNDEAHGASRGGHGGAGGGGSKRKSSAGRSKRARQSAAGSVDLRQENSQLHSRISVIQSQLDEMRAMISTLFARQGEEMPPMTNVAMSFPAPAAPMEPASSSRSKGRDSSGPARDATMAEQKELQVNWGRLNGEQENEALKIIKQSVRVDDSMDELDLTDLDAETFRAVQQFVAKCIGKPLGKKSKSKARRSSSAAGGSAAAGRPSYRGSGRDVTSSSSSSGAAAAAAIRQTGAGKRSGGGGMQSMSSSTAGALAGARGGAQAPGVLGEFAGGQPFFSASPVPQSQNPPSRAMAPLAGAPVPSLVEEDWEGLDDDLGTLGVPPVSGSSVAGVGGEPTSSSGSMLGHAAHQGDGVGGASVDSGAMGASLMAPLPSTTAPAMASSFSSVAGLSPAPGSMGIAGPIAMGGGMPAHADVPASAALPASASSSSSSSSSSSATALAPTSMGADPAPDTAPAADSASALMQAAAARREAQARVGEALARTALEEEERKKESLVAAEAARQQELLERKRSEEESEHRLMLAKARAAAEVESSALTGDDDDDDDMDDVANGMMGDDDDDDDDDDDADADDDDDVDVDDADDLADVQDGQDDINDDDDADNADGFGTKSDALHSSTDPSGAADLSSAADLGPDGMF